MRRPVLITTIFTILLSAVATLCQAKEQPALHSAIKPECRQGGHLRRFNEVNKRLEQGDVDLLFIGDSITAGWARQGKTTWDKFYAPRKAVNMGRSGEKTQHLLWQFDNLNVKQIKPKLAVLLIGTNNVRRNTTEEAIEGVTKVVEQLRKKLPQTKLLLLAVFPRGPNNDDPGRKSVEKINQAISKLHDGKSIIYQDLRNLFVNSDGTPTKLLRSDNLHLMPAGYEAWAKAIEPIVSKSVGPIPSVPDKTTAKAAEKEPFDFDKATRNVPKPRETWPLVKKDMVPMDLKIISDEIVTSDTDPSKKLRRIHACFNSMKLDGKLWTHPCIIFTPADNSINMTPKRKGKVAIVSSPCAPGHMVFDAHVAKYGEPNVVRTGYPTMVLANPGVYPDGSHIERDIRVLGRIGRRTGKYYYNMNCQLAVVYIQAMNALEKVLGLEKVKAVLCGHSKRGLSTPVAAAMDSRVASAVIMGNEGVCPRDRVTPWLSFHYPFYQDQVHVPVFYLGATNEDGYTMFNVNHSQSLCKVPMTIEMIPNYRHNNFSEKQYMDFMMWVAHTFDGRPLTHISDVTHTQKNRLHFYRAKIKTKAKLQVVQLWTAYTDNPEWRDVMWYAHMMNNKGDYWEGVTYGKTPDAFMIEVGDISGGIPGYVSSLPQKLTDLVPKQRPGRGMPKLWQPTD